MYELERRVKTPDKYMFPYYEPLHWYTAEYILLYLKGTIVPVCVCVCVGILSLLVACTNSIATYLMEGHGVQ